MRFFSNKFELYFSESPSKMNFDAKVQHIPPDSKFSQGRKEGRMRDRKGCRAATMNSAGTYAY